MKINTVVPQFFAPATRQLALALAFGGALMAAPLMAQDASAPPPPPTGQHHHHDGDRSARQLEHMTHALNLTPDQVTQIKSIQDEGREQMRAAYQGDASASTDRHEKMEALRHDEHDKIRAVLTDEQKEKFDKMVEKRKDKREDWKEKHQDQKEDAQPAQPAPPPSI